jgi:hypothetical protein
MEENPANTTGEGGLRVLRIGGGHGKCCSGRAFNSQGSPRSSSCGGGSGSCKRKTPKRTKANKRILLEADDDLPNFFEMDFQNVLNTHTSYNTEETRGIIDASNTTSVAKCAVNRYMQDRLGPSLEGWKENTTWFKCCLYVGSSCPNNEDLIPDKDTTGAYCKDNINWKCKEDIIDGLKKYDEIVNKRAAKNLTKTWKQSNPRSNGTFTPTKRPTPRPSSSVDWTYWPTYTSNWPTWSPTITPTFTPTRRSKSPSRQPTRSPSKLTSPPAKSPSIN